MCFISLHPSAQTITEQSSWRSYSLEMEQNTETLSKAIGCRQHCTSRKLGVYLRFLEVPFPAWETLEMRKSNSLNTHLPWAWTSLSIPAAPYSYALLFGIILMRLQQKLDLEPQNVQTGERQMRNTCLAETCEIKELFFIIWDVEI